MQNKSKLNMILLVIIIILLVVTLGYFLFINSKKEAKSEENKNITTNTVVVPSDWKTYTNTEPGFEFKYPSEIVIDSNYGNIGFRGLINPPTGLITKQTLDGVTEVDITYHSRNGNPAIVNFIKIDGQDAKIICDSPDGECTANIVLPSPFKLGKLDDGSDKYFKFLVITESILKHKYVDQILSTFKFTK